MSDLQTFHPTATLFHFSFSCSPRPCPRSETATQHTAAVCSTARHFPPCCLVWSHKMETCLWPRSLKYSYTFLDVSICMLVYAVGRLFFFSLSSQTHIKEIQTEHTHRQHAEQVCLIPLIQVKSAGQTGITQQPSKTQKRYIKHTLVQSNVFSEI